MDLKYIDLTITIVKSRLDKSHPALYQKVVQRGVDNVTGEILINTYKRLMDLGFLYIIKIEIE